MDRQDSFERQEEQIELLREQFDGAKARLMDMLAPALAHEFSNPLSGVSAFLERLSRQSYLPEQECQLLQLALAQCLQMKTLLKDVQHCLGKLPLNGDFDVQESLNMGLRLMQKPMRSAGLEVEFAQAQPPVLIQGDQGQLEQMLLHLLFAVVSALAGTKGHISLELVSPGTTVELILRCRVAEDFREQLMQFLAQFSSAEIRSGDQGAIVRWIVRMYGGTVQVSEPGAGEGTVILSLPKEQSA